MEETGIPRVVAGGDKELGRGMSEGSDEVVAADEKMEAIKSKRIWGPVSSEVTNALGAPAASPEEGELVPAALWVKCERSFFRCEMDT